MTASLALTTENLEAAEERLARDVLPHFGAVPEPVWTDPRADLGEVDDQRGEQSITLLHSLGYLPEPAAGQEHCWAAAQIKMAWAMWREDWRAWAGSADREVEVDLGDEAVGDAAGLNALRLLKACATIEGEVTLRRWPVADRPTLASRITLFRLRLYGLFAHDPAAAMPPDLEAKLHERARGLLVDGPVLSACELVNRLGDLHGLTEELLVRLDDRFVLLAPRGKAAAELTETLPLAAAGRTRIRLLDQQGEGHKALNRLIVRVVQVRLWTLGYYDGVIDGDWRKLSEQALLAFTEDFELAKPRTWIGSAPDGRVLLDAGAILRCFVGKVDAAAAQTARGSIDAALAAAEARKGRTFWAALERDHLADRANTTAATYSYDANDNVVARGENVRRVRYFGWRGIFAAFGRFLRGVGGFVEGVLAAVRKGAGRLRRLLRNIARYVADATRVAVRVVALGVERLRGWLAGTPVVTQDGAHVVATFWQQDFDTVNLISRGAPAAVVASHGRVLDWMQRSLEAMLRVGLAIAQMLLALGNWLLFAWRALQVVRQIVREIAAPWLRELVAETAPL